MPFCTRYQFSRVSLSGEKDDYIWKFLGGFFRFQSSKTTRQVSEDMALSGESSMVDLASETTKRDNDRGMTEVNMAAVLQGLQMMLAHLAKNSELQTEAIQNLKEEFLLCSGDEDTEDTSAMDDSTSDNALDIAATLNNVLDSVKSPESGSQSALVDSLTQAFTTSKVTSPAIEGKIAELINNMLIGGLSAEMVKERVEKHLPPENCKFLAVTMVNEEI